MSEWSWSIRLFAVSMAVVLAFSFVSHQHPIFSKSSGSFLCSASSSLFMSLSALRVALQNVAPLDLGVDHQVPVGLPVGPLELAQVPRAVHPAAVVEHRALGLGLLGLLGLLGRRSLRGRRRFHRGGPHHEPRAARAPAHRHPGRHPVPPAAAAGAPSPPAPPRPESL